MRFLILLLLSGCSLDQWSDKGLISPERSSFDTGVDDSSGVDEADIDGESQESQSGQLSAAEWNDLEHWDFCRECPLWHSGSSSVQEKPGPLYGQPGYRSRSGCPAAVLGSTTAVRHRCESSAERTPLRRRPRGDP